MCGIAGIIKEPFDQNIGVEVLHKMLDAIEHRGKDGSGVFQDNSGGCFLGHRRLSIIDLSQDASQPMESSDGRFLITFNGEIYNYIELAKEFGLKGEFGDTRVLLESFKRWGKDCLTRLRGMFAFAVWDTEKREFFCARDHMGIKPLYWWKNEIDSKNLIFSSEIKAILASGLVEKVICEKALKEYLRFYCVHPPRTIIKNVFSLPAGHSLTFSVEQGVSISRWYDLSEISVDKNLDYKESVFGVRETFLDSVDVHLRSDVPVGLFLSGGIDSSALAGAMAKSRYIDKFHTFSIGFDECGSYLDESKVAKIVSNKVGAEHHSVRLKAKDLRKNFEDFIRAIDQPSGDGLNTFFVSKIASDYVKVALSGLGADELFFGYRYMRELPRMINWSRKLYGKLLIKFLRIAGKLPLGKSLLQRLGTSFARFSGGFRDIYLGYRSIREIDFEENCDFERIFGSFDDELNCFSKAEFEFYTAPMLLRDTDSVSMAHTLEVRVPFLDKELMRRVIKIPGKFKLQPKQSPKKIFVEAMQDILSREVLGLPKRGFEMPVGLWLKDEFKSEIQNLEALNFSALRRENISEEIEQFYANPRCYLKVWSLIVLKAWADMFGVEFPDG
ncbi:asparagine synthase (glutamine-hydrolyzing) [Candidatus Dependentiae bacterium]